MSILHTVLTRLRWHRRLVAALAAAVCVGTLAHALTPRPADTTTILVTAHDVASGARLTEADIASRDVPRDLLPDGALSPAESPVGRTVAAGLPRGTMLTRSSVISTDLAALSPGRVLTAVPVDDGGVASLLHVGDRVDVLAQGTTEPVASGARVAAAPSVPGTGLGSAGSRGSVVIVEMTRAEAARLGSVGRSGGLSVVMAGR